MLDSSLEVSISRSTNNLNFTFNMSQIGMVVKL